MKFQVSQWCEEAARELMGLIDPDVLPLTLQAISDGIAVLWKVTGDGWHSWLITRIEKFPTGVIELVLEVIAGKNCKQILERVFEQAKKSGVTSIRFETHHAEKIAQRFIGGLGFNRVATVFRAEL